MKMNIKNKRVLVTGAAGLLGKQLVLILVSHGYQVTALDVRTVIFVSARSIQADFSDEKVILPLLKNTDLVFHLAAEIGVDNCRLNPEKVIKVNFDDTKVFFENCINSGVKRIVFSSSSEVYGDSDDVPFKEDGKLSPYSIYGKNKVLIENYLKELQANSNVSVGIVRFFNVYGPGQKDDFVVPIFINNCFANLSITVHGDGQQTRCFTYVADAAMGLFKMGLYESTKYEIVNIGRNVEYTMMDLAKSVKKAIPNSTSEIILQPYGLGGVRSSNMEVKRRVPSINKAKTLLGFEAITPLEDGIRETVSHIMLNTSK